MTSPLPTAYADLINSGKATPVGAAMPVSYSTPVSYASNQPNFSTGALITNPSAPRGAMPVANTTTYAPALLGDPEKWNMSSDQTVSGQMDNVLKSDSLPMQRARTQGLQLANERGLFNTSMAVGAAQDSLIGAALPIAQADATAYLGVNRYNVDTANTFATTNAKAQTDANSFNAQQLNATDQFNAGNKLEREEATRANDRAAAAAAQLAKVNAETAAQLTKDRMTEAAQLEGYKVTAANFKANVDASLAQINNEASTNQNTQQQVSAMAIDFMNQMNAINRDTNMDQQSKDYSINQLFGAFQSSISLISAVGAVPNVATLLISGGEVSADPTAASFKQGIDALFKQYGPEATAGSFKQGVAELLKQKESDPVGFKQSVVELLNQKGAVGAPGSFKQGVAELLKQIGG